MVSKVIDFDAWRKERQAKEGVPLERPIFVVGGKEYLLPAQPPAAVVLDVVRLKIVEGEDISVPLDALRKIGENVFGVAEFREILEQNQMGALELGDLIQQAFRAWPDILTSTEDAVPNRRTRRSRKPSTS